MHSRSIVQRPSAQGGSRCDGKSRELHAGRPEGFGIVQAGREGLRVHGF